MPARHVQVARSRAARRSAAALLATAFAFPAAAQKGPPACPFALDALEAVFGVAFGAGVPEPGIGTGCVYRSAAGSATAGTGLSLGVYINAAMPEATRRMMLGGGRKHELAPVPGDPDNAVVVRHRGDVPPFPQVAYVRGGQDVMLQVTGMGFEPDEKARGARIERLNQQLLKLPRVP
jgi:hypothetical protein